MDGTGYVITEIVAVLVIVTLIGIGIGWLLSARMNAAPEQVATPDTTEADTAPAADAGSQLAESAAEVEELRKQLAQAEWRISTLEEALAAGD